MINLKSNRRAVRVALATATIGGMLALAAGGTGAQSGISRGTIAPGQGGIDPILVGTIDLHAHQGPDDKARSADFIEAAQYARMKGMRGLVLKSHYDHTAIQAFMVRKYVPGFEAFGTIDLNRTHGGMNPFAVEHFASISMPGYPPAGYGRMVMMGSYDVPLALANAKSDAQPVYVVRNGAVVPEAKAVIAMVKKHNLSITTGHNSGAEALLIIKEAIAQGIPPMRLSVTHANEREPGLTLAEMQEAAALGAFVEMAGQSQRALNPEGQKALDAKNDRIADLIKKVGPEHIIMESDLGQGDTEYIADGLASFVRNMRARGISAADTDIMTKRNPARFLGIPEVAPLRLGEGADSIHSGGDRK
jgi:hypothetical protein